MEKETTLKEHRVKKKRRCGFKKYLKLFTTSLYISAFTFGGGFVIISLMRKKYVTDLKWLEEQEMLDLTAIAQSSPGAIAVNASILLGYKIGGILGALVAIVGTILPPMIIISIISLFYNAFKNNAVVSAVLKGMQAGVAAVLCDVVISMAIGIGKEKNILSYLILAAAFILTFFLKINVALIIAGCIAIGIAASLIRHYRNKKKGAAPQAVSVPPQCEVISERPFAASEELLGGTEETLADDGAPKKSDSADLNADGELGGAIRGNAEPPISGAAIGTTKTQISDGAPEKSDSADLNANGKLGGAIRGNEDSPIGGAAIDTAKTQISDGAPEKSDSADLNADGRLGGAIRENAESPIGGAAIGTTKTQISDGASEKSDSAEPSAEEKTDGAKKEADE